MSCECAISGEPVAGMRFSAAFVRDAWAAA